MINLVIEPEIYTQDDLEQLNAQGGRYELIRGELKAMSPAGADHGSLTVDLITLVHGHVLKNRLGRGFTSETGFIVNENPRTILAPDYAFIARERMPAFIPKGFMPSVPDLVLETRSPGDTARAVAAKIELWLEVGARGLGIESAPPNPHRLHARSPATSSGRRRHVGKRTVAGIVAGVKFGFKFGESMIFSDPTNPENWHYFSASD